MKRLLTLLTALLVTGAAWAQSSIRVEVHNIVELSERFNLVFIVEGEHAPSDFQWNAGDDITVVWGPQKGTSRSVQMINGKTTRSSQTSYTYILQAKKTGSLTIPPAVATVKGDEVGTESCLWIVISPVGPAFQVGDKEIPGCFQIADIKGSVLNPHSFSPCLFS